MCSNQLKLNEDKLKPFSSRHSLCPLIAYRHQSLLVLTKLHSLTKLGTLTFTMKQHVIKVCQTAYYEQKRIGSVRSYLIEDATKKLVTSRVLSRLDYCNSILMGTPNSVI